VNDAGLTINPKKIQLCRQRFKVLGFIVDRGSFRPDPQKIAKVRDYPVPKRQKDVYRFLGLLGFYRRFIKNFAGIAKSLSNLLKKDVKFEWAVLNKLLSKI